MPESGLYLHEEIMLLALHDEKGTVSQSWYSYGIAGAALAELLLAERLGIEESKRSKLVVVANRTPIGEPLLDECLARVADAKRRASLQKWVGKFASIDQLKQRVADRLYMRGILRKEEGRVLLVFSRDVYPTANPQPEREIVNRVKQAVFGDGPVDPRTGILVTLANHAGVLRSIIDKKQLKERKRRLEEIAASETVGTATRDAVAAAHAAIFAATTAATVAASS